MSQVFPENRVVHPIEQESFRRLRARLDTSHFPPLTRAVVERVIHSAADLDYADDHGTHAGGRTNAPPAPDPRGPVGVGVVMLGAGDTRR
ncbi:precorrin-8X methylmutase, partial [Streptomyces sp. NPDC127044]